MKVVKRDGKIVDFDDTRIINAIHKANGDVEEKDYASEEEIKDIINLVDKRYSIFSKEDHIVPYTVLNEFSNEIKSIAIPIDGIGHMGKKSGLEELTEVINIVLND